jgi:signal transduction histidine kinase
VERMSNMLQELIEFTRPSGQQRTLREVEFARYMNPLLEEMRPELAERRVTLVMANAPPRARVRIDPPRLSRLFHNLISNAVEAMSDGGEVRLQFAISGDELRIDVQDTGPGIAPEIADTLFSPFATHGKPHGTGLGLSISRKIAHDHGGRIWAGSVPGQGATFSFTLPVLRNA